MNLLLCHCACRIGVQSDMAEPGSLYDPTPYVPPSTNLDELKRAVDQCRGCPLYAQATQGVFGAGPLEAKVLMIGEQPGDQEARVGKPFVGPAGRVLDKALVEAGIDRADVYVTNAVKHFKWTPKGERRIHAKPNRREVQACRPWLEHEVRMVKPSVVVALGATAALSIFGRDIKLGDVRGKPLTGNWAASVVVVSNHPSSILRVPEENRDAAFTDLVRDLRVVAALYDNKSFTT